MPQRVTFTIGRFGPFDGELSETKGDIRQAYQLSFGPLYVNASAMSAENYIKIRKRNRTILEGTYSGTITVDKVSHATYGELTIEP